MKIFITGNPGCGKTTLLKEISQILKEWGIVFTGFITDEVRKGNTRTGFTIQDLATSEKLIFASTDTVTPYKFGKYCLNLSNFESVALKLFRNRNLILIDEIGKMEFYSNKFKNLLLENIKKDITIIATLHRDYVGFFKSFGRIYNLTSKNYNSIKEEIIKLINLQLKT